MTGTLRDRTLACIVSCRYQRRVQRKCVLETVLIVLAMWGAVPDSVAQILLGVQTNWIQHNSSAAGALFNSGIERLPNRVVAGPKITVPETGQAASIIVVLRRKKAAGQFVGGSVPSLNGGTTPMDAEGKGGLLTPGQTLLSPTTAQPRSRQAMPSQKTRPGTHPASAANQFHGPSNAKSVCMGGTGISAVDHAKSGAVFSPGYSYSIQGCGFGANPGRIYLTGIPNQNISNRGLIQAPTQLHSDWVALMPTAWSDSSIEAVVDPSASGFYDSANCTVQIVTSDQRTLWSPGFHFFATRAPQTLASVPSALYGAGNPAKRQMLKSGIDFFPTHVNDAAGNLVQPHFLSPSAASLVLPGHTFAVVRDDNAAPFPPGTDTVDLVNVLHPDFEIQSVQPFYANLTPQSCSLKFTTNGNWNTSLTGIDKISIAWQEQGCGNSGVSVYALDITVIGPIGVRPF